MCEKCIRAGRKAKMTAGKINFFAHYIDRYQYASVPLFSDKATNLAIEGRLYQIQKAKTKRRYNRKKTLI